MKQTRQVTDYVSAVVRELCNAINSPISTLVGDHLVRGNHNALLAVKPNAPESYSSAASFADDYLVTSILSKWKGLNTKIDTAKVAIDGWSAAELRCKSTNERIRRELLTGLPDSIRATILEAQRIIQQIIGPAPRWTKIGRECRFSNGATLLTKRGDAIDKKMTGPIAVTRDALPLLSAEVMSDPAWLSHLLGGAAWPADKSLDSLFKIVEGSRTITVPKNAKTDRTIGAEPAGNSFLQQGVGRFFRSCLKRFGVDLDDQGINQYLAGMARCLGLATLDLSAASDTICLELVYLLLPIEWAILLDTLRSKFTKVNGDWVRLEKFSSMGNAFTFELETLIFYSLSKAASIGSNPDPIVSVYGDDIIVESKNAESVIEALEWCGFSLNREKSFVDGPFYESCGEHYFQGDPVTPVYQKEIADNLHEVVRCHNRLHRWLTRNPRPWANKFKRELFKFTRDFLKSNGCIKLPRIPLDADGDDGLLVPHQLLGPFIRSRGYRCVVWVNTFDKVGASDTATLAYKLRHPGWTSVDREGHGKVAGRRSVWRYAERYIDSSDLEEGVKTLLFGPLHKSFQ